MDQTDPLQVVPRQVYTPYSRLLISTALVVVSRVSCLGVTGVYLLYIIFIPGKNNMLYDTKICPKALETFN